VCFGSYFFFRLAFDDGTEGRSFDRNLTSFVARGPKVPAVRPGEVTGSDFPGGGGREVLGDSLGSLS